MCCKDTQNCSTHPKPNHKHEINLKPNEGSECLKKEKRYTHQKIKHEKWGEKLLQKLFPLLKPFFGFDIKMVCSKLYQTFSVVCRRQAADEKRGLSCFWAASHWIDCCFGSEVRMLVPQKFIQQFITSFVLHCETTLFRREIIPQEIEFKHSERTNS